MGGIFAAIIILSIIGFTTGTIEEDDRELVASNFPYGRGVVINILLV